MNFLKSLKDMHDKIKQIRWNYICQYYRPTVIVNIVL